MNGSGGNFAKGLLIKPAIDWLRAQWSPNKRKAVEDLGGEKAESYRLPGRDPRADKRADLPVRYSKVKASMRSALITAKDPWRRKMAVNRLENQELFRECGLRHHEGHSGGHQVPGSRWVQVGPHVPRGNQAGAHRERSPVDRSPRTHHEAVPFAVTRGLGPRKKAPQVPVAKTLEARITKRGQRRPCWPYPRKCSPSAMWMLREVEVASLKQGDLLINEQEKRVLPFYLVGAKELHHCNMPRVNAVLACVCVFCVLGFFC